MGSGSHNWEKVGKNTYVCKKSGCDRVKQVFGRKNIYGDMEECEDGSYIFKPEMMMTDFMMGANSKDYDTEERKEWDSHKTRKRIEKEMLFELSKEERREETYEKYSDEAEELIQKMGIG